MTINYHLIIRSPEPDEDPLLGHFRGQIVPRIGETVIIEEPRPYAGKVVAVDHRPVASNTMEDPAVEVYLDPS